MKAVIVKNGSAMQVTNTIKEAVATVYKWYANTVWQEQEDVIEIRNLVIEPNGYEHTGDCVFLKQNSSHFWAK